MNRKAVRMGRLLAWEGKGKWLFSGRCLYTGISFETCFGSKQPKLQEPSFGPIRNKTFVSVVGIKGIKRKEKKEKVTKREAEHKFERPTLHFYGLLRNWCKCKKRNAYRSKLDPLRKKWLSYMNDNYNVMVGRGQRLFNYINEKIH